MSALRSKPLFRSCKRHLSDGGPPARSSAGAPQELANASSVGVTTIRRAELTQSQTKLTRANDQAIRRALEAAGGRIHRCGKQGGAGGPGVTSGIGQFKPEPGGLFVLRGQSAVLDRGIRDPYILARKSS